MKLSLALGALFIASASADVEFSRTVDSVAAGLGSIKATLDHGCSSSDQYGSNNCKLNWGDKVTAAISGKLNKDISSGQLALDVKVDIIPLKANCQICGANCTITVPIVKKTVSFGVGVPHKSELSRHHQDKCFLQSHLSQLRQK